MSWEFPKGPFIVKLKSITLIDMNFFEKKYFNGRLVVIVLFIGLLMVPNTGCKVQYSFTGASISPDVKTVSIDYFQNYSTLVNPILSSFFTEALKDRFITQTSLNLVKEYGDLQFSGQITSYTISPIAIQSNEVAAKNRLSITIKVKFENTKDNKYNFDKTFTQFDDFDSSQEFSTVESALVKTIVDKIVDEVFNNSVANW
jgi:hypothetical protein